MASPSNATESARVRPGRFSLFSVSGLFVLAAVTLIAAQLFFGDRAVRFLASLSACFLFTSLGMLWALAQTWIPGRRRLGAVAAALAGVVAIVGAFRLHGVSGNMVPDITWRKLATGSLSGDGAPAETARNLDQWAQTATLSMAGLFILATICILFGRRQAGLAAIALSLLVGAVGNAWASRLPVAETRVVEIQDEVRPDVPTESETDFPQFLGKHRDGSVVRRFGIDWKSTQPVRLWRRAIGEGWSGFSIVGGLAFTQVQYDNQEHVECLDLATGDLYWTTTIDNAFVEFVGGNGPRGTPTFTDGRLYVLSANGMLACLDVPTGAIKWSHDLLAQHHATLPEWGKSCSPVVAGDFVIVCAGGPEGHSLVAYQKQTGDLLWQAGDDPSSYATPVVAELAGQNQVVMVNAESVVGHDLSDGRVLWRYVWPGGFPKVPQPVPIDGGHVLIGAGYGLGTNLLSIETKGEAMSASPAWDRFNFKLKPKFTNLVVRDGHVYGIDDGKALVCMKALTGEVVWKKGRYGHGQVLLAEDTLVIQTDEGEVVLVPATPSGHHEIGRFQALSGKTWNPPAIAGRYILMRNATEATCFELPQGD